MHSADLPHLPKTHPCHRCTKHGTAACNRHDVAQVSRRVSGRTHEGADNLGHEHGPWAAHGDVPSFEVLPATVVSSGGGKHICLNPTQNSIAKMGSTSMNQHIQRAGCRGTCMRVAADDVEAMTKPLIPRPAITPPLAVPAHAANAKMTTCPSAQPGTA